ncbi:hypothetical protein [Microcoleus asticus]|uniref:hypothetical protein n=1 Tax=Microcoleus asticus TaxID=2815231 RepID=UPI001C12D11A|nr:hypothetical protein [Microcoleus asticus]
MTQSETVRCGGDRQKYSSYQSEGRRQKFKSPATVGNIALQITTIGYECLARSIQSIYR